MANTDFKNVNEYILHFDGEKKERLKQIRETIKEAAKDAEESISYQIPAYKLNGYLIYFSAAKNHISILYPFSRALLKKFEKELSTYKRSKAAIQFPDKKELPLKLISKIVEFRKKENEINKTELKNKK